MEFHADAVSASVEVKLVTALRKLGSPVCYQTVIQKANDWLEDNADGKCLGVTTRSCLIMGNTITCR